MDKPTFLSLGDDLILQVYEELNSMHNIPTDSLPLVCKYLQQLLFPAQMRILRLWDHSDWGIPTAMERRNEILLRDGAEKLPIVKAIREVRVEGCHGDEIAFESEELECILAKKVQYLNSFVWNSPKSFPRSVEKILEERFPGVRLRVPSLRTEDKDAKDFWDVDARLLASPLLHALDIDMHWSWTGNESSRRLFSQFRRVFEFLRETENAKRIEGLPITKKPKRLRNLKIGFDGKRAHGYPGCRHCPPCFLRGVEGPEGFVVDAESIHGSEVRFSKGFTLGALVKMVRPVKDLGPESKAFLEGLTNMLFVELGRVKWLEGVRYLELHGLSTKLPFMELIGRVPNLRYVEVDLDEENLVDGLLFLGSLENLRELSLLMEGDCVFVNWPEVEDVSDVWHVVERQRATLKKLVLHTKLGSGGGENKFVLWREHIEALATSFPILDHLEIDITLEDAQWLMNLNNNNASEMEEMVIGERLIANLLAHLSHLHTLRLVVNLTGNESDFHSLPLPPPHSHHGNPHPHVQPVLNLANARVCLVHLLQELSRSNSNSELRLEKVEVVWMVREAKWEGRQSGDVEDDANGDGWKGEVYERETAAMRVKDGRGWKGKWGLQNVERVGEREWRIFGLGTSEDFEEGLRWKREERVRFVSVD